VRLFHLIIILLAAAAIAGPARTIAGVIERSRDHNGANEFEEVDNSESTGDQRRNYDD
jgi:hypothetical protein